MTDNGSCYRSHDFAAALGDAKHLWTRPYRPQTNGKVERFNRTLATEWATQPPRHRRGPLKRPIRPGSITTITTDPTPASADSPLRPRSQPHGELQLALRPRRKLHSAAIIVSCGRSSEVRAWHPSAGQVLDASYFRGVNSKRLASRTWCSCSTLPFQGMSRGSNPRVRSIRSMSPGRRPADCQN